MVAGLVHTPLAKALGWTLVHFLWEGAAVAALLAAVLLVLRPTSARVRYALACAALVAMLGSFAVTLGVLWPERISVALPAGAPVSAAPMSGTPFLPPMPAPDRLPWIVPFWMAGVLVFYARTTGGWLAARRLCGRGTIAAPPEWQAVLLRLATRLRVKRPVALLESCLAETPIVIGALRPVVLVPAGLLTGLAPELVEAVLLHELAHIRRHDYIVNLVQGLVEGLLFYHPAVWWISRLARAERENCCDDVVVAAVGDVRGYAAALAALEERRSAAEPALAASGGNLMARIRRLVEPPRTHASIAPPLAAGLLLVSVAVALCAWQPAKSHTTQVNAPAPRLEQKPAAAVQIGIGQEPVGKKLNEIVQEYAQSRRMAVQVDQESRLRAELARPYRKWLDEDVAYIITDEERGAFNRLQTDEEREHFIEQFWLRRDPTSGTVENEFKEEYYRRIAYANEHLAESVPGWKTDRGRIYILHGPPDEIESHADRQVWLYRHIDRLGDNVRFEFTNLAGTGRFVLQTARPLAALAGPVERTAKTQFVRLGATPANLRDLANGVPVDASVQLLRSAGRPGPEAVISVSSGPAGHEIDIYGRITTGTGRVAQVFEDRISGAGNGGLYQKSVPLARGHYRLNIVWKDMTTGQVRSGELDFEVE